MRPRVVQGHGGQNSPDAKALYDVGTDLVEWLGPSGSILRPVHRRGFSIIGGRNSIADVLGQHAGVAFRAETSCVVYAQRTERQVTMGLQNVALGATLATGVMLEGQREYRHGERTDEFGHRLPGIGNAVAGAYEVAAAGMTRGLPLSIAAIGKGLAQLSAPKKYTILSVWPDAGGGQAPRIGPQFTAGDLAAAFAQLVPGL